MSTNRKFVYDHLNRPGLQSFVQDRVFPQGSLLTAQTLKPFLVYSMGNNTDEEMSDPDNFRPNRQFFTVWVHGEEGSYDLIDDIVDEVKKTFVEAKPSGSVCGIQYLETSADHDDPTLQSLMRYVRFQLAQSR